jgi:hypothetical protein
MYIIHNKTLEPSYKLFLFLFNKHNTNTTATTTTITTGTVIATARTAPLADLFSCISDGGVASSGII